jgi:hypothetical protein
MKKVGIVADNYKVPKFREALNNAKIVFTEKPFTRDTTAFFMLVNANQVDGIRKMCVTLEINFKQSN